MSSRGADDRGPRRGPGAAVAVDAGKTTIRATTAGRRRVQLPGVPTVADPGGAEATLEALVAAVDACDVAPAAVAVLAAGLAGLGQAPEAAQHLATGLQRHCPRATVVLTSDVVTSHLGALGGGPGVVLAAGTGAVALAVDARGRSARVDGWGHLLGDDGSGYAVGRAGLAAVLRAHDGRGGATALTRCAGEHFGAVEAIVPAIHGAGHPARAVAAFAPAVLEAAVAGDAVALGICERAGEALARTARAAAGAAGLALPAPRIAVTGGLLTGDSPLRAAFLRALGDLDVEPAAGDALDGALRLATCEDGPHRALVSRFPPPASTRTDPSDRRAPDASAPPRPTAPDLIPFSEGAAS